jgi:hypothetical protein
MLKPTRTIATVPVAPEIIPGLPPISEVIKPKIKAVYSPTIGETPAIKEKAIASGTSATATTKPDKISFLIFADVYFFKSNKLCL